MTIYCLHAPFPIWNQSDIPCPVLTFASWSSYRYLRRQVRLSGVPITLRIFHSFFVIHTVKGFGVFNKMEVDIYLELLLFWWSKDVGNLISGPFSFSKSSLNIWEFTATVFAHSSNMAQSLSSEMYIVYVFILILIAWWKLLSS